MALQAQTMLLDEGHERLYVGAKNALFSLSLDQINTDHTEVGLFPAVRQYAVNAHTHSKCESATRQLLLFPDRSGGPAQNLR